MNSQESFNVNFSNYIINDRNMKTTLCNDYFTTSRSFKDFVDLRI